MAIPFLEFVGQPFTAFNFSVEIDVGELFTQVCHAAFSECDGLEVTMEPKTIREGGNNGALIRLTGPVGYGTLTLKRGMTANFDLWDWFDAVNKDPALRAKAEVVILDPNAVTTLASFVLTRCVPVKLKAPALNAVTGGVAVEELQLAYETLALKKPDDALASKLTGGLSEQFGGGGR